MLQLRDRSRWPPPPRRPLIPITPAEFARAVLTADDLRRLLVSPDGPLVAAEPPVVTDDQPPVERG
jgi:hypothetical protein